MSLTLDLGTTPAGLSVKTFGFGQMGNTVYLGEYEISLEDFLIMSHYVLTNTDLESNDPRRQFVECVKEMQEVSGFNAPATRLRSLLSPIHQGD